MKKVLAFIKNNIIFIIIYIILLGLIACEFIELDYSVYSPGGLDNVGERLSNKLYESKGSFNMTYVTYRKGTIFNLMIAKLVPSQDIVKNEDITADNETINDRLKRSDLLMKQSISLATLTAYTKAEKKIDIIKNHVFVYYKYPEASSSLSIGDEVLKCDDLDINDFDDIKTCIDNHSEDDEVTITVLRNNKEVSTKSKVLDDNMLHIIFTLSYDFDKEPDIKYKEDKKESGSSGGLILALSIYDALVEEDITKGMKIAGTGTIEIDGSVGEIAGVKYKIKGAAKNKVDLFIVPSANYEEAEQVIKENHYNIKLLKADTFDQVLEDLKNYN
ncbi:MAG: PDZ domain-containing protein [Bacilli bacterium]|nr:PDZ domain-containing protein [Bacilli bacterium]